MPVTKKVDIVSSNARLWASELYREHGRAALAVLDQTKRRTKLTPGHQKALAATRSELIRIIDDAAKIEAHRGSLSPFRRFLFRLIYKQTGHL